MRIDKIVLCNFRHHRNTVIDFKDGITALIGPNGSGKSTIFEGISFALYGSQALRTKMKDLIPIWDPESVPRVELEFTLDKKKYSIIRTINGAELKLKDKVIVSGTSDVSSFISNLLKMTFEQFTSAFYAEQKKLEFLSRMKSRADRENFILEMLGYDIVDKFIVSIREEKKETKGKLQELSQIALNNLIEDPDNIYKEISDSEGKLFELEGDLKRLIDEINETRSRFQELSAKLNELNKIRERAEVIKASLSNFEDPKTLVGKLEDLRLDYKTLESEILEISKLYEADTLSLAEAEQQVRVRISELKLRGEQLNKDIQIFEQLRKKLGKETLKCPTCGQELRDPQVAKLHLESKIKALTAELDDVNTQSSNLENEIKKIDLKRKQLLKQKKDIDSKTHRLSCLKEEIVSYESKLELIKKSDFERQKLVEELAGYEEKLCDLEALERNLATLEVRLTNLNVKERTLQSQISNLKADIKAKRWKFDELNRMRQEAMNIEKKKQSLEKKLDQLEVFDKALIDFRFDVSSKLRPYLSELASKYVTKLTNGKITSVTLDKFFDFSVLLGDDTLSLLSGGEEDVVSLSLRLALSEMIVSRSGLTFEFLILDEVFGYLDSERRYELLNLLRNFRDSFRQIFVISHIEMIQDYADNVIMFDVDPSSGVIIVTQVGQ